MDKIELFSGDYAWLSNFSPFHIIVDGMGWPTVEHYYQAMKSPFSAEQDLVRFAKTPGRAKRLGKSITLRPDWDIERLTYMSRGLIAKFTQHDILKHPNPPSRTDRGQFLVRQFLGRLQMP